MGIDAEMIVRTTTIFSKIRVRELAYALAEAFGHEHFFIDRDGKYGNQPRRCLEIIRKYEQDGPTIWPANGEMFIRVHLWTRYYGPGYERGDLPLVLSVASWLEVNIPDCEVWYGGDSSGVLAEPLSPAMRAELWNHFCKFGHLPYKQSFDKNDITPPDCLFCAQQPMRCGWGNHGKWGEFYCPGCGWKIQTDDGGQTFKEANE